MQPKRQKIIFEVEADEELTIIVEPEACEWKIKRGDKFEIAWPANTSESPSIVWYGQNRVAFFPPAQYELRLNGLDAFELL
jgi:hypothetical protein